MFAFEDAVIDHHATIRFTPEFIKVVRAKVDETLADADAAQRLHREQLQQHLDGLEAKEENLLDLAADG